MSDVIDFIAAVELEHVEHVFAALGVLFSAAYGAVKAIVLATPGKRDDRWLARWEDRLARFAPGGSPRHVAGNGSTAAPKKAAQD